MGGDGHRHPAGGAHGAGDAGAGSGPRRAVDPARQRRVLWLVLAATAAFMVVEAVAGVVLDSLALLADAAHMLSDVVGLAIAVAAQTLAARPASGRHTWGLGRAEVLGAQANGVVLVATAGWVAVEAVRRLPDAPPLEGAGLLVVATGGLLVNVVSAIALHRVAGGNLNVRGAVLHMGADALGSVGAMAAGAAVLIAGAAWVDPAVSLAIAALVLLAAWRLLREALHVLLDGVPRGLDPAEVERAMAGQPGVVGVHHLHVWTAEAQTPALSAHVVLDADPSLHEAQEAGDHLRSMLAERFGVAHATLELECHVCAVPQHDPPTPEVGAGHLGHGH